jgi:sugar phosphate isomerase/epimerase
MEWPIIMHVNYCEQGQTIEEICEKAVKWGFDGVEFRRMRKNEETEQYLDRLKNAVEKSGLWNVIFGGPGFDVLNEDENIRKKALDEAVEFYTMASERFKLTVCNILTSTLVNSDKSVKRRDYAKHGSFVAKEEHYKMTVEAFDVLGALARKLDFKLAFETHMNFLHDLPEATKKLVEMIGSPNVGVNLDYGNAVFFDNIPSLEETILSLKDMIYYVHMKNYLRTVDGTLTAAGLGDGVINHREYVKLLKRIDYKGPICIEAPRQGDREWYARQDIKYIKALLEDL